MRRRDVLYLTIDTEEDLGHEPNIAGLRAACAPLGLEVHPRWFGALRGRIAHAIESESPTALYLSGSFTEWYRARDDTPWGALLDEISGFVRSTKIPIFATCGSHQLVARTFGDGWRAVGHMGGVTIAEELTLEAGKHAIPSPRIGEVGTFPLRVRPEHEGDPLFASLAGRTFYMTQSHRDEAREDGLGGAFDSLVDSVYDDAAIALEPHARCRVQALRLRDPERMLYSTQFHPELTIHPDFAHAGKELRAGAEARGTDGYALLGRFLSLAVAHWERGAEPRTPIR